MRAREGSIGDMRKNNNNKAVRDGKKKESWSEVKHLVCSVRSYHTAEQRKTTSQVMKACVSD